jgi:hypothetical protein
MGFEPICCTNIFDDLGDLIDAALIPGQTHVGFSLFKRKVTAANLSLKFSVFLGNSKPQTRSCSVHLICKSGQFARREFALALIPRGHNLSSVGRRALFGGNIRIRCGITANITHGPTVLEGQTPKLLP